MRRAARRWPMRLVELAAVVLLVGTAAALLLHGCDQRRPFDRAVWLKPVVYKTHPVRYYMVDDLQARHLRLGMLQRDVVALLGPPERTAARHGRLAHQYVLGYVQGWVPIPPFDPTLLELTYDGAGRLAGMEVYEE